MSVKLRALIITFLELVQELDDTALDCYVKFRLPYAEGPILEWLGNRVGQKREGRSDADFRTAISARILVNRSNGTREQVLRIAEMFSPVLDVQAGGGVVFIDLGYVPQAKAQEVFNFVRDALETTVRLQVKYCPSPIEETFTIAKGTTVNVTGVTVAGATSLPVLDTSSLPSNGTVLIGIGTPSEQLASYTSKTATTLDGFTSLLAQERGTTVALSQNFVIPPDLSTIPLSYGHGHYATTIEG